MKPQYYLLLAVLAALVLIPLTAVLQSLWRARKTEATARDLGMTYRRGPDFTLIKELFDFELIHRNRRLPNASHIRHKREDATDLFIFEFTFSSGGVHRAVAAVTLAYLRSERLNLPRFIVRRRRVAERYPSGLAEVPVPELGDDCVVESDDETACRRLMSREVLEFISSTKGLHLEGGGNQVYLCFPYRRVAPEDLREFHDTAREAFRLLCA